MFKFETYRGNLAKELRDKKRISRTEAQELLNRESGSTVYSASKKLKQLRHETPDEHASSVTKDKPDDLHASTLKSLKMEETDLASKITAALNALNSPWDEIERILKSKNLNDSEYFNEEEGKIIDSAIDEFIKTDRKEITSEIEKKYGCSVQTLVAMYHSERLKRIGLDGISLNRTEQDMREVLGETFGRTPYLAIASLINNLTNGKLDDKLIVEIGPGQQGIQTLEYFSKMGAHTIGIDENALNKTTDKLDIVCGSWEDIVDTLSEKRSDVIFFHHMDPVPHSSSKFPALRSDGNMWSEYISIEMDKVLKPGGIIIQHNIEADYHLNGETLRKLGYLEMRIDGLEAYLRNGTIDENFIKTYQEEMGDVPKIHSITIFQKPEIEQNENVSST